MSRRSKATVAAGHLHARRGEDSERLRQEARRVRAGGGGGAAARRGQAQNMRGLRGEGGKRATACRSCNNPSLNNLGCLTIGQYIVQICLRRQQHSPETSLLNITQTYTTTSNNDLQLRILNQIVHLHLKIHRTDSMADSTYGAPVKPGATLAAVPVTSDLPVATFIGFRQSVGAAVEHVQRSAAFCAAGCCGHVGCFVLGCVALMAGMVSATHPRGVGHADPVGRACPLPWARRRAAGLLPGLPRPHLWARHRPLPGQHGVGWNNTSCRLARERIHQRA